MLLIAQHFEPDGGLESRYLAVDGGALVFHAERTGEGAAEPAKRAPQIVAFELLYAIFRRYGKPLADDIRPDGPRLTLPDGAELIAFRHLARFDVVARDWLAFTAPGQEPAAELATSVTAALEYLLHAQNRAAAGEASEAGEVGDEAR